MRDPRENLAVKFQRWLQAVDCQLMQQTGFVDLCYDWVDLFGAGVGPREAVIEWWADAKRPLYL